MTTKNPNEVKEANRIYEVGFLVSPEVAESKVGEEVSKIKAVLEKHNASTISDEFPKMRQLSYLLTWRLGGKNLKVPNAYFGWIKFELDENKIDGIKTDLNVLNNIVRFLIIKTVRENVGIQARAAYSRRAEFTPRKEMPKQEKVVHSTGMTDAELEKTIEELVVE